MGDREPEVYGSQTLEDHVATAQRAAEQHGLVIEHMQTNHEGDLVEAVHAARDRCAAIVINPGAFTHYAWSIHDALAAFDGPVVELHLSNPNAREAWRSTSVVAPVASGTIAGFGGDGYRLAIDAVAHLLGEDP
ncbi:MAG: 3-dehydroquinate dehydratase [Actinomycetota bacterium]|nr:3-dehydroquinate dehydratase [Actinomycetota bacterium]